MPDPLFASRRPWSGGPPATAQLLGARLSSVGRGFATVTMDLGPLYWTEDKQVAVGIYTLLGELSMHAALAEHCADLPGSTPMLVQLATTVCNQTDGLWMEAFARVDGVDGDRARVHCSIRRSNGEFAVIQAEWVFAAAFPVAAAGS